MNYELNATENKNAQSTWAAIRSLSPLLVGETMALVFAVVATLLNSGITLAAPLLIAYIVDTFIIKLQFMGVLPYAGLLLGIYLVGYVTSYLQTRLMGGVGRRLLFRLQGAIFAKLQELPVAFFYANKTGDLISRINSDTDKLNQFFARTLVQFIGSLASMVGAGIFLVALHPTLGLAALSPAAVIIVFTVLVSAWVKQANAESLKATGDLSAEVAESLQNFKVVVAFNRRDFFRKRFSVANELNFRAAIKAGVANMVLVPAYTLAANAAQLIVLAYGMYLITMGDFTLGLLISFISYVTSVYNPLRQLAGLWADFQQALAGWDRISVIMQMKNQMTILSETGAATIATDAMVTFKDVTFSYTTGKVVLQDINLELKPGRTYALVGPTGGGKTTTASLMARLYDPTSGTVYLSGRDIRTYSVAERAAKIGFILQDPILFSGTVKDNILYGNEAYQTLSVSELETVFEDAGLSDLVKNFEGGLSSTVATSNDELSLGQKQLIAFMRALLRKPELLILDEATANIDTVTEKLLESIIAKLPATTTKVIIAHRLSTIEDADEIFFINDGTIVTAGSMEQAAALLRSDRRSS
jgi:ATP-binding cassette subfamily B protein